MLIIGLTGGIGSGKSTVAARFRELGAPVIDADEISRELVEPGTPALAQIVDVFGDAILDEQGRLDRAALRTLVFADSASRNELETILHPLIRQEMRRRMSGLETPYCILAIPLLLETRQTDLVDRVLVVDAPRELQLSRAASRDGVSVSDVEAVMAAQVDRQTRLAAADDVIVNDQDLDGLYRQVDAVHRRYLQLATNQASGAPPPQSPDTPPTNTVVSETEMKPMEVESPMGMEKAFLVYELPLNERIRTLLRLECLFGQVRFYMRGTSSWESRAAVASLLDLLDAFGRVDLKKELLQEMERLAAALNRFITMPGVNKARLEAVLRKLNGLSQEIHAINGQIGQGLRQHELLSSIKQRACTSSGACSFDLPVYFHWLNRPAAQRQQELAQWFTELEPIYQAVEYILELIRDSAVPNMASAPAGFFQQTLDTSQPVQLVQVHLPPDLSYFAEISGGKHRFSVRFMQPQGEERAVQVDRDVQFRLSRCVI